MTATANARNVRQYKIRFSLIIKLTIPFDLSPRKVREVRNLPLNFKQIRSRRFTLLNIQIARPISSLNSKQLQQSLYPNSLYIVEITCTLFILFIYLFIIYLGSIIVQMVLHLKIKEINLKYLKLGEIKLPIKW